MEDGKFDKRLEDAFAKALREFFPKLKSNDDKADFFAVYQKEADESDRDFTRKHDEDLNATLIFAGLFSAVTAAFVLDVQTNLQPDFTQETAALLRVLIHKVDNSTFPSADADAVAAEWTGPDAVIVHVQVLLYASLAASLLAASLAVIGKQWLNRYTRAKRGSIIERCQDRQRKADGMKSWRFTIVMGALPLMLQASLLLLGCALSRYLWPINRVVASINIALTSLGVFLYLCFFIMATSSYDCPYQTPLSLTLRRLIDYDFNHSKHIHRFLSFFRNAFTSSMSSVNIVKTQLQLLGPLTAGSTRNHSQDHPDEILLDMRPYAKNVAEPFFHNRDAELRNHCSNAACISWILETSTDPAVTSAAIRWIPAVEWHDGIAELPSINTLYYQAIQALSCIGSAELALTRSLETRSSSLKALAQIIMQRPDCENQEDDLDAVREYQKKHSWPAVTYTGKGGIETFFMTEIVDFYLRSLPDGGKFSSTTDEKLSPEYLSWMAHNLVYLVWKFPETVPQTVYRFLYRCFSQKPELPKSVFTDCILMLALGIGTPFHSSDLSVMDKSDVLEPIFKSLLTGLDEAFKRDSSHEQAISTLRLLPEAMPLVQKYFLSDINNIGPQAERLSTTIISGISENSTVWETVGLLLRFPWASWAVDPKFHPILCSFLAYVQDTIEGLPDNKREEQEGIVTRIFNIFSRKPSSHVHDNWHTFVPLITWGLGRERTIRLHLAIFSFIQAVACEPEKEMPAEICQQLSPALRDMWNDGPNFDRNSKERLITNHAREYFNVISGLTYSPTWLPFYIKDHWRALRQSRQIPAIPTGFGTLLKEASLNDHTVTTEWLKMSWNAVPILQEAEIVEVVEATLDFFGDGSLLEGLEENMSRLILATDEPKLPNAVRARAINMIEAYFASSWKRRLRADTDYLVRIFNPTVKLYLRPGKGYDAMDEQPGLIQAWLKAAWCERGVLGYGDQEGDLEAEDDAAVKEATSELFRRGGDQVMKKFEKALVSALGELEKNRAYLGLLGIGEGSERFRKIDAGIQVMKKKRKVLRDICDRSRASQ